MLRIESDMAQIRWDSKGTIMPDWGKRSSSRYETDITNGESQASLARHYGVCVERVEANIINRKTWRHI